MPRAVVQPVQRFLDTEAAGGVVLLAATAVALVWANSPWSDSYLRVWHTQVSLTVGGLELHGDLQHWVNDLAMAVFFFVAGLEIKRELVHGDLRAPRSAALPIACAVGGMVVPAALFVSLNAGGPFVRGWGIPMATDIAFAVGVLALLGRRAPPSLRVFLLTLAIVDDLGAILVIAVFYTDHLAPGWLLVAVVATAAVVGLSRLHVRSLMPYVVLAGVLWLAVYESGVHATIAGVVLGLLTPARPFHRARDVQRAVVPPLATSGLVDDVTDEADETTFFEVVELSREAISPLARLERALHPWSSYVLLPLFALANAGIALDASTVSDAASSPVTRGIVLGLVVGKPIGIVLAAVLVVRLAGAALPAGVGWTEMVGIGALAGIGFTVSLFITGLAYDGPEAELAKIGILAASVIAGVVGSALLLARAGPVPDPL